MLILLFKGRVVVILVSSGKSSRWSCELSVIGVDNGPTWSGYGTKKKKKEKICSWPEKYVRVTRICGSRKQSWKLFHLTLGIHRQMRVHRNVPIVDASSSCSHSRLRPRIRYNFLASRRLPPHVAKMKPASRPRFGWPIPQYFTEWCTVFRLRENRPRPLCWYGGAQQ